MPVSALLICILLAACYRSPGAALADLNLRTEEVTDIIVTHMHWDHVDGADLFPRAKIWVQRAEYEYYVGRAWQESPPRTGGIAAADIRMSFPTRTS